MLLTTPLVRARAQDPSAEIDWRPAEALVEKSPPFVEGSLSGALASFASCWS
jgi:hypothetical protein